MQQAVGESSSRANLNVIEDGESAIAYLRRTDGYTNAARPNLIFLALNLAGIDGHDVLPQIKGDEGLRGIPVVVLTHSKADGDVANAYDLRANCYVCKPEGVAGTLDVLRACHRFWVDVARLPLR